MPYQCCKHCKHTAAEVPKDKHVGACPSGCNTGQREAVTGATGQE